MRIVGQKEGPWNFYPVNYILFSESAFKESLRHTRISNISVVNAIIEHLKSRSLLKTRRVLSSLLDCLANALPCNKVAISSLKC